MAEPRIIELDPGIWARGKKGGSLLTFVGDRQRQQCCIGVACTVLGVSDDVIGGHGMIEDLQLSDVPNEFESIATIEQREYPDDDEETDYIAYDNLLRVYNVNDDEDIKDDAERVELINKELASIKAPFRFALKQ